MLARLCSSDEGSSDFFLEIDSAECSGHDIGGCEDGSCYSEVDESESGWILGMISASGVAAVTDRDEAWDELVLDSGSVSTACPYSWCADIRVNDKEKAYLQDIQQRRSPSHGSRVVPLELWGPEGNVQCMVKFDVADVAYPVVSLGKMIETGITFSFDDYKYNMHRGNRRVEMQNLRVANETKVAEGRHGCTY